MHLKPLKYYIIIIIRMLSSIKKYLNYDECPICFNKKCLHTLNCKHKFCNSCLNKWSTLKAIPSCPLCREEIKERKFVKYNVEIIGLLENESLNPNKYFSKWNEKNCINEFHKFTLSKCDDTITLFCEKCQKVKFFSYP